jgi:hypothetical protein
MSWCWFAVVDETDDAQARAAQTALASAHAATDAGATLVLAAWPAGRKPLRHAVRMDGHVVDPDGEPAWLSLVVVPPGREPLFDDPAVSGALRRVLDGPPADAVSTFVRDSSHFAGAVTVERTDRRRLHDDPFARLHAALVLRVEAGLFGKVPPPPGPVTQRYAGQPWPAAGFEASRRRA